MVKTLYLQKLYRRDKSISNLTKFYTFVNKVLKEAAPTIDPARMVLAPLWYFKVHAKMRDWPQYRNLQREQSENNPETD